MATFDFSPMLRSSVGFDELPALFTHALEREDTGFPPYNIEKIGEDRYRIVLAVAGFGRDDIEIVREENRLTIRGMVKRNGDKVYLYRGLAQRPFVREFDLADYVEVTDASLADGLLVLSLKRELPEALKPRTIPIATSQGAQRQQALDQQAI
jgi:molecular chaperone IbpA